MARPDMVTRSGSRALTRAATPRPNAAVAARTAGLAWCAACQGAGHRASVDLQIPAAAGTAGAPPGRVAEGQVTELPAGPGRAGDGLPADDQDAADADLDGQVQHHTGVGGGAATGLSDAAEGGVV